jgi:ribonuclease HII
MRSGKVILLKPTYNGDSSIIEVGVDEAGRGALAGPVTVAACIMPADFQHELIRDSKLLSEGQRAEARQIVLDNAIAWAVRHVDIADIEYLNILGATLKGMDMTLLEVSQKVEFNFITVDGDQFHGFQGVPFETIVGGDNKYINIAAASILAKTERDMLMKEMSEEYPEYGWGSNKGYGSAQHRNAIKNIGICEHHRPSFVSHMTTTTASLF